MTNQEIKALISKLEPAFYQKYGVALVYLFGSINSERFAPESDVDVAVLFEEKVAPLERFRHTALMQSALRKRVQRKVDVTILNFAPPLLRYEVVKGGSVCYFSNPELIFHFQSRTYRDYEDYCHFQSVHIAARQRRILGVEA